MNTTLTEHTTDYYEEYYPTPRVEKAIFKYLDDLYYVSEDDVFFTIYKKENDWFMKIEDIAKEIETLFGLSLPERIKVGPDKHIEPARNPIPNRVIKNWTAHHQTSSSEEDKEIAEVIKEHVNPKLINKFLKEFWPQHRSQIYSQLYNTYHPSNYEENFNRPSGNFEDALETVADAVHEGKKLGLIDSSVDWSDIYNYEDSDGYSNPDQEKKFIDDDGIPTLNNQLEILDNTNLDWIHGILLFDVLEDIVEEFRCYCGENGVDPKCEGKCMDEFPPDNTSTEGSVESFAGTLKQDYYTLYNFMRELERAGVTVTDYMKDPTYPNIIKLVDDGSTDYDTTGEYSPMRQDSEAIDTEELFEDAPDRIYEHKDSKLSPELMVGDEILVVADGHDSFDKRPELYIPHVVIGVKYTPRTSSKYYEIEPIDMTDEHRLGAMLAGGGKSRQILLYPGDEWVLNPGFLRGELTEEDEIELSPEDKKTQIDRLETELDIDREDLKNIEKELDKINSPDYKGTSVKVDKDDEKKSVIGIGKDASAFQQGKYFSNTRQDQGDLALNMVYEQEKTTKSAKPADWEPDFNMSDETKELEKQIKRNSIEIKKQNIVNKEKRLQTLKQTPDKASDSTGVMGDTDSTDPMSNTSTDKTQSLTIKSVVDNSVTEQDGPEFDEFSDEELEKRRSYDDFSDEEKSEIDAEYVDMTPFTRKEVVILKTLHKNLTKEELYKISDETPEAYGTTDKKFWSVMKLFGIEETHTEQNTRESRYAKWAYDNWTEDGDYGSIEEPIKAPLKWYNVDRDESGSQIEYKSGEAEVLGFDEDDAGERADYDFYAWGGEMETNDYGDYESYDSEITASQFLRMDEQIDPALKHSIDQQHRTNPELRDEILQSIEDEEYEGNYHLNPEEESPILNVPPIKIAQKFSDVNGYGKIKFDMQGGNGIAYFTDKDLVIKLTADDSEYFTANKLIGIDNEYIVKVIESAKIKTSHSNHPIFVIVEEALPMTEEMEEKWSECCCGVDSPIHIDYLEEPALVLPPVSQHDKCLPIYDNIIGIQKNFAEYGITWSDIGINNMGIKNGKLVVVDLGETRGQGSLEGKIVTLEHIEIRPLTSKQIKKQLVLI